MLGCCGQRRNAAQRAYAIYLNLFHHGTPIDKKRIVRQAARLESAGFTNWRFYQETYAMRRSLGAIASGESEVKPNYEYWSFAADASFVDTDHTA